MPTALLTLILIPLTSLALPTDSWPEFRGPHANGHAHAPKLPFEWSPTKNVAWKTPIHDRGWSSPVIWQNQIWLTATKDGHQLFAICLDRRTGKILHDVKVFDVAAPEHVAAINSYASPTPAVEAGRVYVHYGTYGTAALDTNTGKILWARRDLNCDHEEGPGASPILFDNLLVFNVDGRDVQYVVALDKNTGKNVWKTNRSVDYSQYSKDLRKSFCTPIVIRAAGRLQLISPGAKAVMAYDPNDGTELWKIRYRGWSIAARPLFANGLVFLNTGYVSPELWAVRPHGTGDVTDTHVVWKIRKSVPATSSFLLIDDLIFMTTDRGIASCVEAKTGQTVWKHRLNGDHLASPIYAAGRIYFFNRRGRTTVIQPTRQFKILAENDLNEELMASPAVADNALFVRTRNHLYRIELIPPKENNSQPR